MPHKRSLPQTERVVPGRWIGQLLETAQLHLGQEMQPGPPPQPAEFSYLIVAAILTPPAGAKVPAVVMLFASTGREQKHPSVGMLQEGPLGAGATLSLDANRDQFSDLTRVISTLKQRSFAFTLGPKTDDVWPVTSWGISGVL